MVILPPSPPNASSPPPSEEVLRSLRKWLIWITALLSIIGLVLLTAVFFVGRHHQPADQTKAVNNSAIADFLSIYQQTEAANTIRHHMADQTEAVNNAHEIGLALIGFQDKYGKFPDPTTIAAVQSATGNIFPSGTKTSNDFFRQLFASGLEQREDIFYAKIDGTHNPDSLTDGSHLLAKGECGFTYFLGITITDNPRRPLVVTPMIPGTDRFDPKPFNGKAVVLKMDLSVTSLPIDKDGHIFIDGRNLMDPHHPIWEGHAPAIAWPDL